VHLMALEYNKCFKQWYTVKLCGFLQSELHCQWAQGCARHASSASGGHMTRPVASHCALHCTSCAVLASQTLRLGQLQPLEAASNKLVWEADALPVPVLCSRCPNRKAGSSSFHWEA
jgi:hypothetical protein